MQPSQPGRHQANAHHGSEAQLEPRRHQLRGRGQQDNPRRGAQKRQGIAPAIAQATQAVQRPEHRGPHCGAGTAVEQAIGGQGNKCHGVSHPPAQAHVPGERLQHLGQYAHMKARYCQNMRHPQAAEGLAFLLV